MGQPAAKKGDLVVAVDTHFVLVPPVPTPTPLPHPFRGVLANKLSDNVLIMGQPAAHLGSEAVNTPHHIPTPPGTSFVVPPLNKGVVASGSASVFINGKPAARNMDKALTCNDPAPVPIGTVLAAATVLIGG
jgi:uncharacterized Zn-binding protein involved in type VI secretion